MKHLYLLNWHLILGQARLLNFKKFSETGVSEWDRKPYLKMILNSPLFNYENNYKGLNIEFNLGKLKTGTKIKHAVSKWDDGSLKTFGLGLYLFGTIGLSLTYFPKGVS